MTVYKLVVISNHEECMVCQRCTQLLSACLGQPKWCEVVAQQATAKRFAFITEGMREVDVLSLNLSCNAWFYNY